MINYNIKNISEMDKSIFIPNNSSRNDDSNKENTNSLENKEPSSTQPKCNLQVKLCGYLDKLSSRGLIKTFKRRWFVYAENSCRLYYYRVPQDILPLGVIDIANATFSFDLNNLEKPGLFEITSGQQTSYLEALDRHTMMFWLQELQKRRRDFSKHKTDISLLSSSSHKIRPVIHSEDGLLAGDSLFYTSDLQDDRLPEVLTPVSAPFGVVGEESAYLVPAPGITSWSLSNIKTHVINSMAHWKSNRHSISESLYSPTEDFTNHYTFQNSPPESASVTKPSKNSISELLRRKSSRSRPSEILVSAPSQSAFITCNKCNQLQLYVVSLKDDVIAAENELKAREEVIKSLQKQLDYWLREKQTILKLQQLSGEEEEQLQMLIDKDRMIVNLEHVITLIQDDKETLRNDKLETLKELETIQDQLSMYEETIKVKDEIIINLTNKIYDIEQQQQQQDNQGTSNSPLKSNNDMTLSPSSIFHLTSMTEMQEKEKLKDANQAYILQNKFLNQEILELNLLREDAEKREKHFLVKSSEWEAKYYQIKSKYLILLNEMHIPLRAEDEFQRQEVVNQLLQDAFEGEGDMMISNNSQGILREDYDILGFSKQASQIDSNNILASAAQALRQKSLEIEKHIKDTDYELWINKWHNFMHILGNKEIQRSGELKTLIRTGIPHEYRGRIWKGSVSLRVLNIREQLGYNYYQSLLSKKISFNPAIKQIELDLLRTLPTNKHYEKLHSRGIPKLRRILQAYSYHNPAVGYCQGLNRLVAIALLYMKEEDAFWCLVAIVDFILPCDYYTFNLSASQADQRVLKDLMADKLPKCYSCLEQQNIDLSMFTFNWFLTIFVDNIPPEIFLRIWDVFLYEGSKVLFRFALAFFKTHEEEILQLQDTIAANNFLRTMGEGMIDLKKITQIAFNELNPFPMKMISAKRAYYLHQVKMELEQFEKQRTEFRSLSYSLESRSSDISDEESA